MIGVSQHTALQAARAPDGVAAKVYRYIFF